MDQSPRVHSSSEPWSFSKDQDLFKQARLLIVDDDPAICDLLKEFLNHLGAHCDAAGHASQAADFIQRNQYDAILSDIYMPEGVRGLALLHFSTEHSPLTPFILMTGHPTLDNAVEAIRMGAYDFLTKPFNLDYVELMLSRALHYRRLELENQNYQAGLERKVEERTREVHDFLLNSVQSLSNALEARDPYTQGHAQNVSDIVVLLAHEVGMDEKNDIVLRLAAQLHDIGKIGIPDSILLKPGKLNQEEWEVMRKHPEIGYRILSPIPSLQEVSRYVYEHHERWDGGGYPQGLRGEEIHPISRLLITAERYDALSSERVYKKAWPREKIVAYYRENAGKAFDPDTAEALVRLIERNKLKTWDRASATLEKAYP